MPNRSTFFALVGALVIAGGYALFRPTPAPPEPPPRPEPAAPSTQNPHAGLPPGHPPVQGSAAVHGRVRPPPPDEPGGLDWTAPSGWASAPNPNSMRLATYKIPHTGKDTEDAELSVSRAGGSTEANIQRWIGQFDEAGKDTRNSRTIAGMTVTTVEVSGTYLGGMMGGTPAKKPGWALLAAVVETEGSSYFFKMTGPKATVQAARGDFGKMLDSLKRK